MHIGYAKGRKSSYEVRWDEYSHEVYIDSGAFYVGKASSAKHAILIAEAFLAHKGW